MATAPPRTGDQIDQALSGAVRILETTDRERRRLDRLTAGSFFAVAVILAATVAVAVLLPNPIGAASAGLVLSATTAVMVRTLLLLRIRRADVRRARRAMMSAVDDVREVMPLVARKEEWDPGRREAVRAILARFPVEAA